MNAPEEHEADRLPAARQFIVAIALLAGFAVLVVFMLLNANGDANVWDRQIYIFGAVEAIVFTAVGWIFGREVHRASLESAREDAQAAKTEAAAKGEQVVTYAAEAVRGRALKAGIESADAPSASSGGATDVTFGGQRETAESASTSLAMLRSLAAKLYEE